MSNLEFHLTRLIGFLKELSVPPPVWSDIAFIEESAIRRQGAILQIPRTAILTQGQFTGIFDDYLDRGYGWLNMYAFGVMDDTLLIIIERPSYTTSIKGKTSVNLSGPSLKYGHPQWDISQSVCFVEE